MANGVVYVGSNDNNVYALDAATGTFLWSYATGDQVVSSPTVVDGVVYIGSGDYNVYAFNLSRGDEARQEIDSRRPNLKTLRPDLDLKVSNR